MGTEKRAKAKVNDTYLRARFGRAGEFSGQASLHRH
jgi:hypothetical protein